VRVHNVYNVAGQTPDERGHTSGRARRRHETVAVLTEP
jgi:hypothetical protein